MRNLLSSDIVLCVLPFLAALFFSPLMIGVINRVKAVYAGRKGQPLIQLYLDIFKLIRKSSVYSRTTSWIFRIAPVLSLASILIAVSIFSFSFFGRLISFNGDFLLAIYLLGLARFATVMSAIDTGSSFEGMGASRELMFAPFAEVAFLILMLAGAATSRSMAVFEIFSGKFSVQVSILMVVSLFILLLVENCRVPVDDPNTHLELTMIHEVMVLDNSGPDFAFILYGAALKLWFFASLISCIILSCFLRSEPFIVRFILHLTGIIVVCICVGIVESVIARFRFEKVRRMLLFASVLSCLALILAMGVSS